jgi:hypothetical protein
MAGSWKVLMGAAAVSAAFAGGAVAATLEIQPASGVAGQTTTVSTVLRLSGEEIAGTQNDIRYDPNVLAVEKTGEGKPQCQVTAPGKTVDGSTTFSFGFLKGDPAQACNPDSEVCDGIRAIVVATDNVAAIADNTALFSCTFRVLPGTANGSYTLTNTNAIASDPTGNRIGTVNNPNGAITVGAPTCCGDTNGNGVVSAAEATSSVLAFAREDLNLNPAADCGPANGSVSAAEASRAVVNFAREECN